jgi:hypothetical protein
MKQLKIWSIMMLMVVTMPLLMACGDDGNDGNDNDSPSYTESEIVELLTGTWNVRGEYNLYDNNTSFLVGTYTGTMQFKSNQSFTRTLATTSTVNTIGADEEIIASLIQGEFMPNYHQYSIRKSGGQSYILFSNAYGITYKFAIKALSKNSFRLECDQDVVSTTSAGKSEQVVSHVHMTIVSQEKKTEPLEPSEEDMLWARYQQAFILCTGAFPSAYQDWGFNSVEGKVRVIAEDLVVSPDFDFNDVVFDVEFVSVNEAKITLQAAGSTLPICIGDEEHEVHHLFGVATSTMVNTASGSNTSSVTFNITGGFYGKTINIPVKVKYKNKWIELSAKIGEPPAKIAVSTSFEWPKERVSITKYPYFVEWIQDKFVVWY